MLRMPFKLFQDIKVATSFTDFIGIICMTVWIEDIYNYHGILLNKISSRDLI